MLLPQSVSEHRDIPRERRNGIDRRQSTADLHERLEAKRLALEHERRTQGRRREDADGLPESPTTEPAGLTIVPGTPRATT